MKILLVNKFHYNKGGSETFYFALAEILAVHGHEVIHFAMQDEHNSYSPTQEYFVSHVDFNTTGGKIKKIKAIGNMFYSKEAYSKMKELLKKEKPDIVHLGLVHKQITYSILKAIREEKIPVVQSVHDLIFVCPCYTMLVNGENCQECVSKSTFTCVKKKCVKGSTTKSFLAFLENKYIKHKDYYNQIDVFITECEFYKEILERANFTNACIINRTNFLPPSKSMEESTYKGDYFLFFGRFSPEKGILTLLKAYKRSNIQTKLILVGGGPLEEQIKQFILENGLKQNVKLAGYVYGNEMEELLRKSKAVIVPSEWYENCPYSIIEAMGKSRIVIASRIAGLPELIEDGKSGFLFTPNDSDDLAQKICKIEQMSDEAYSQVCKEVYKRAKEQFDPEKYYQDIITLYQDLIKKEVKDEHRI